MQHWVSRRRETSLEMRDLQLQANPCTACVITRNWSRGERFESARRLSFFTCESHKSGKSPIFVAGPLSAVAFNPKARQCGRRRASPSRVSSVSSSRELPHVVGAAKAGKAAAAALTDSAAQARLTVTISASPRHGTRQPEP
jgi:hypothetical protein